MPFTILNLDKFRADFANDAAFQRFVNELRQDLGSNGLNALFCGSELVGAVLSPTAAQESLCAKLREKLIASPKVLTEILDSLKSDDIVD